MPRPRKQRHLTGLPAPMTSLWAAEADRLEALLALTIDNVDVSDEDAAIIGAAALEVAELDYLLANGRADLILWTTAP